MRKGLLCDGPGGTVEPEGADGVGFGPGRVRLAFQVSSLVFSPQPLLEAQIARGADVLGLNIRFEVTKVP